MTFIFTPASHNLVAKVCLRLWQLKFGRRTTFLFPFLLEDVEKQQNKEFPFLINLDPNSIEENSCFLKFYCFPCKWKDKTPCYYFMINENIFTFQGGQVILNNFMQIQLELEKIMWNINTLCLNIDRKLSNNSTKKIYSFFI